MCIVWLEINVRGGGGVVPIYFFGVKGDETRLFNPIFQFALESLELDKRISPDRKLSPVMYSKHVEDPDF